MKSFGLASMMAVCMPLEHAASRGALNISIHEQQRSRTVRDIAIRYKPPRRGRFMPIEIIITEAQPKHGARRFGPRSLKPKGH